MTAFARFTWQLAIAGRWTARILGSLMVLFLLAFFFGEGRPPLASMTIREQLYALGMAALFLGLVLAWFREGWGGLLSVLGWSGLAVLAGKPVWDMPLSIPAALGLLHILCWWRLHGPEPPPVGIPKLVLLLLAPLGIFILLCANEIFGQPPLMTGAGQLPAGMVGTWHQQAAIPIAFTIAPDGSVSGMVGGQGLIAGRLVRNRSWFGWLMHWRTEYLIRGAMPNGDRFSAPVDFAGPELQGTLFLSHDGAPTPLQVSLRKR